MPTDAQIKIAGTDRTSLIVPNTIQVIGRLRKGFGDELSFMIKQAPGSYQVEGGSRVDFYLPGLADPYFVGYIGQTVPKRYAAGSWEYQVKAYSAEQYFFRRNIQAVIRNQTVAASINQILKDPNNAWPTNLYTTVIDSQSLLTDIINGFTITGAFAYEIFDLFAELTNTAWRVTWNDADSRFELSFYNPADNDQGLSFTLSSENYHINSFEPVYNLQNVVNRQRVKGGKIPATSETVAYFRGDDLSSRFDLPTKPFNNESSIIVSETFAATSINEDSWTEIDTGGNFVYLSNDGYCQFEPTGGNTTWVGLLGKAFASRAKKAIAVFDFTWVSNGPCYFGLTTALSLNGYSDLEAGFYVDGTGLLHTVDDGAITSTGVTLSATGLYRLKLTLSDSAGASFEYQTGANFLTRNWTALGSSATGTETALVAVVASQTGNFALSSIKVQYPYLNISLRVDRGSGMVEETCGLYPVDQDMDAVILDEQVLAFWGSDPGPSTIPPAPDFKRTITTVTPASNQLDISGGHKMETGNQTTLTTTGTLPAPLVPSRPYYLRSVSSTAFTLHPTLADAQANTNTIDITDTGTGTHTMAPGPEYKNIEITYTEAEQIIATYQDDASVTEVAALFGGGDDGIRDGTVIVDSTINTYETAYAKAKTEVDNRKNLIESLRLTTMWSHLTDKGETRCPTAGDTVNFSMTLPTVNHLISCDYPINRISLRANKNASDFEISLEAAHFKKGMLDIFRTLRSSGQLITLSENAVITLSRTKTEAMSASDAIAATVRNTIRRWGDSRMNRTFTADAGTDVLTTGSAAVFVTGDKVMARSTGTLPAPLTSGALYYAHKLTATTFKLYDTEENAIAGGATGLINITDTGTGTHTLKPYSWRWNFHNWGSFVSSGGAGQLDFSDEDNSGWLGII
jgi:hypothetical protein